MRITKIYCLIFLLVVSCFQIKANQIYAWGANYYGEANPPSNLTNVVAVSAGNMRFSMALKSDGKVVVWGSNSYGETNIPVGLSGVVAISAGWGHCLVLKSD